MKTVMKAKSPRRDILSGKRFKFRVCIGDTNPKRGVQREPPLAYGGLVSQVRNKLAALKKPLSGRGVLCVICVLYIFCGIYSAYAIYTKAYSISRDFPVNFPNDRNNHKRPLRFGHGGFENFLPERARRPATAFVSEKRTIIPAVTMRLF
jgi:hypothetical protein